MYEKFILTNSLLIVYSNQPSVMQRTLKNKADMNNVVHILFHTSLNVFVG